MPGSFVVKRWVLPREDGVELGPIMSRSMLIVISVRKSHFEDVADCPMVCQSAVLSMNGTLGTKSFSIAEGVASIAASVCC